MTFVEAAQSVDDHPPCPPVGRLGNAGLAPGDARAIASGDAGQLFDPLEGRALPSECSNSGDLVVGVARALMLHPAGSHSSGRTLAGRIEHLARNRIPFQLGQPDVRVDGRDVRICELRDPVAGHFGERVERGHAAALLADLHRFEQRRAQQVAPGGTRLELFRFLCENEPCLLDGVFCVLMADPTNLGEDTMRERGELLLIDGEIEPVTTGLRRAPGLAEAMWPPSRVWPKERLRDRCRDEEVIAAPMAGGASGHGVLRGIVRLQIRVGNNPDSQLL